MTRKEKIFSGIIIFLLVLSEGYLRGPISGIIGVVLMSVDALVFYGIYRFWKWFRKRETIPAERFFWNLAFAVSWSTLILGVFLGSFVYYSNQVNPATLAEITISNGKKTIVFQSMAHIGSDRFYAQIVSNIREYKKKGYVLFFEGVRGGKPENEKKFDSLIGFTFDKKTYTDISKLYGMRAQNNAEFLNIENDRDVNVDTSIDEIISIYEKKHGKIDTSATGFSLVPPLDVSQVVDTALKEMNEKELFLFRQINKAMMNLVMRSEETQEFLIDHTGKESLFGVILDDRNAHIVKEVLSSREDRIYMTYGAMHFKGIFALLKQKDKSWEIKSKRFFLPID